MLIFHCADTHLGKKAYNKTVPSGEEDEGLNQREVDIYTAWDKLVDEAIKIKPDVFIHAGDFFDSISPSKRAIVRARNGLYKLSDAGIESVILAGNHETPRMSTTDHVFNLLKRIPSVSVFHNGKPETVAIGDLLITGVAHSSTLSDQVNSASPNPNYKYNLLVTHGTVIGLDFELFKSTEIHQTDLHIDIFQKDWDYIALGHIHKKTKLQNNMYYCGSPERLSFAEEKDPKGYILMELPGPKVKHKKLEATEFISLNYDIELDGHLDLTNKFIEMIKTINPEGKVIRLRIENLKEIHWTTVDKKSIQMSAKRAKDIRMEPKLLSKDNLSISTSEIGSLPEEFKKYITKKPIDGVKGDKELQWLLVKAEEELL